MKARGPRAPYVSWAASSECWCTVVNTSVDCGLPMRTGDRLMTIAGEEIRLKPYEETVQYLKATEKVKLKFERPLDPKAR